MRAGPATWSGGPSRSSPARASGPFTLRANPRPGQTYGSPHPRIGGIRLQSRRPVPNTRAVMFDRALNRLKGRSAQPDFELQLEACPMCHGDFVNPVDWEPVGDTHWWM